MVVVADLTEAEKKKRDPWYKPDPYAEKDPYAPKKDPYERKDPYANAVGLL